MTSAPLPCPFCGAPAACVPLVAKHYGCSSYACGAYLACLSLEQWNSRAPRDKQLKTTIALYSALNAIHGSFDRQLLEVMREDPHDDDVFSVDITFKELQMINRAILDFEGQA